jgi:hypothetical protein
MPARPKYQPAVSSTSGTFSTKDASSGVTAGTAVLSKLVEPTYGITANVALVVKTLNLALRGKWQGSSDNSTWTDYGESNNAAQVTIVSDTGTATRAVAAPNGVLSREYSRYVLYVEGGSTGTASDTYTVSYNFIQDNRFPAVR